MLVESVYEFQVLVLGNDFPDKPKMMKGEKLEQTLVKLNEEIKEFEEAEKLSDQADALVDLIYFALGALHQCGVETERVWSAVHHANMTKKRGMTKRGFEDDAAKPDNWKAPDHTWLDEV